MTTDIDHEMSDRLDDLWTTARDAALWGNATAADQAVMDAWHGYYAACQAMKGDVAARVAAYAAAR